MASTYQLKSRFQSLLRPWAEWLHARGVVANQVTVAACLFSVLLGGIAIVNHSGAAWFFVIALWFLLRMAANALDGMLARDFGHASRLGAVLNEVGDVISDIALYLPFAWITGSDSALVFAIVLLGVISEFAGVLSAAMGGRRSYKGPMGKSDRALVFGVIAFIVGIGHSVAQWINFVWLAVIVLLLFTIINRCRDAVQDRAGDHGS